MTDVLASPVLILNRYFEPVQLTTAKRAFVLLYGGAASATVSGGEMITVAGPLDFQGISAYQNNVVDSVINDLTSELSHDSVA